MRCSPIAERRSSSKAPKNPKDPARHQTKATPLSIRHKKKDIDEKIQQIPNKTQRTSPDINYYVITKQHRQVWERNQVSSKKKTEERLKKKQKRGFTKKAV